jgi:hypothetical protein
MSKKFAAKATISCASSVLAVAVSAPLLLGCSPSGNVQGNLIAAQLSQGLQIGSIVQVSGTYEDGKCMDPASGTPRIGATWSAGLQRSSTDPTVVQNDSHCVLDLTAIAVQDSQGVPQQAVPSSPAAPCPLGDAFMSSPVVFSYQDSGTGQQVQFFVNANLSPADFSSNFAIQIFYSDSLDAATAIALNRSYATVTANEIAILRIPAPSDTLSFAGVTYRTDAANSVTFVSQDPSFTTGSPAGTAYVIASGACPNTLSAVAAAYSGGTEVNISVAPTASDFGLAAGTVLTTPLENCMIIANCEPDSNVCSYQMFDVIFN